MSCAVRVGMIYAAISKESVVFVYYHTVIDGFLSARRHNQLSCYGRDFGNLWVTADSACHCGLLPEVIRVSVTSEQARWDETRCPTVSLSAHLSCMVTPPPGFSSCPTLLGEENTPFSPVSRFYSHPHRSQTFKDWYQCDANHRLGKAARAARASSLCDSRQSHRYPRNAPFPGSHWNNVSSFLEKISQAEVYIQYMISKSSLDSGTYLWRTKKKKIPSAKEIVFIFYFFLTKINNLRNKSTFFSWLYKRQNSMTLVTLAFTLLLSLKANSLDTPCL